MGDAELLADFRARAATVYHPVGTCRMGKTMGESVVDPALRVHGIERLRVVDARCFPTVTSANTNAPTLMVAQKAADLIIENLKDGERMKLDSVKVFVVGNPPPGYGGRYFVFLKLQDRVRHRGRGRGVCRHLRPASHRLDDRGCVRAPLPGARPFPDRGDVAREPTAPGFSQRPDLSLMGVISGLEMACWDIIGKAVEQPIYQLLGGRVHERLRSYTYLYPADRARARISTSIAERSATRAAEYVKQGFTGLKFDPTGGYLGLRSAAADAGSTRAHRALGALGARGRRAVKRICWWARTGSSRTSGAIRLAKRLEIYDPLWFEEPVPPEMPEQMAMVARGTSIPIATGERLTTKYEFARVLATGAANILQMNLGRVGGLLEAKKVAALAEVHYAQIAPHLYCGPGGRRRQHSDRRLLAQFSDPGKHPAVGRLSRQDPQDADSLGGGICDPADRDPDLGSSSMRRSRSRIPMRATAGCTSRWSIDRWARSSAMRYGFVGLGHLGRHLAANLARGGFDVGVTTSTAARPTLSIAAGAHWVASRRRAGALLRWLDHVPALSGGDRGGDWQQALPAMRAGSTWIEMSTNDFAEVEALAARAAKLGIATLACPVTGGVHRAEAGDITVFVGGAQQVFQEPRARA